jgi:hypothetical protein
VHRVYTNTHVTRFARQSEGACVTACRMTKRK